MNKSKQTTAFLIAAVLILTASISALTVSAGETPTVSLADFEANPASTIKAPLMMYNVTDVAGGEFNTSFDPSVVYVTDISEGDIGTTTSNINNEAGWAYMNVFGSEGKSGDVVFAYLNLTAVGSESESSSLNLSVISLFNTNYMDISYKTDNGTFTIRDITPPASISDLQNTTGTTWINWTWTNPSDNDFNHTMVYLDGTWQTNTSNSYYNATGLNPDTTYEIGTHTVDTSGNVNNTLVNQTAKTLALNSPPIADPNGPYTGMEGVAILFNGSGSYDYDGSIVAYEWDFDDGNTATVVTPTHTYAQNGAYTVTLTVTDNDGATNRSTTTATIADTEPTADFSATPTSGQEPLTVTFSDNSTSYDGIVAWDWDFNNDGVADSTEQNPTHVYAGDGVYAVSLTVTESDGDSDTMTKMDYITVIINNPPYTAAHNPAKDATAVPRDTNIVVHVKDDDEGVDKTSLVMTVEGIQVTPAITGTRAEYTLTYDPSADFDYGQVVDVTIDAQDLASPSNAMPQDSYSFTIESAPEIPDLEITDIWNKGSKIYYKIKNNGTAKAGRSRTSLTIDGTYKKRDFVTALGAGAERTESFRYKWTCAGGSDKITVCADYKEAVAENNETNNFRTVTWSCL